MNYENFKLTILLRNWYLNCFHSFNFTLDKHLSLSSFDLLQVILILTFSGEVFPVNNF